MNLPVLTRRHRVQAQSHLGRRGRSDSRKSLPAPAQGESRYWCQRWALQKSQPARFAGLARSVGAIGDIAEANEEPTSAALSALANASE